MLDTSLVTLAVLAGGEGSRMGRAKGLLRLGGQPVLEYLVRRFAWPGPTLLATAPGREKPPGWELFGREVADPVAGEGPLRGLLTALEACDSPLLLATTVDMPGVGAAHLRWLVEAFASRLAREPQCLGLMTRRRAGTVEQIEPFPSAFARPAAAHVRQRLEAGARSVHSLAEAGGVALAESPDHWAEETWTNLNRPEDVERFERDEIL